MVLTMNINVSKGKEQSNTVSLKTQPIYSHNYL